MDGELRNPFALLLTDYIAFALATTVLVLTIIKSIKIFKTNTPNQIGLMGIWFFGLLSFLFTIFSFIIKLYISFDGIQAMGEISPAAVAGGLKYSTFHIITGFPILIISVILWGALKAILNKKIRGNLLDNNL